jgi:hypothetical protein
VEGHWQECQDSNLNYVDCPKDKLQDSIEESFFIPGLKKEDAAELCKVYEQDAVIYGGKDTDGNAHLIFKNGGEENIGQFEPGKVSQAYSKIKGNKTFVFNVKQKEKEKEQPLKFEPKAAPAEPDMKLKSLLPKGLGDKTIRNPETGKDIKLKSALKYDDNHIVKKAATAMVKNALKK